MILYLLGIGSPTHAIPAASWRAWSRPLMTFQRSTYVSYADPLFVHQYSHAWVDFRGRQEPGPPRVDWFENSVIATRAHRAFCLSLSPSSRATPRTSGESPRRTARRDTSPGAVRLGTRRSTAGRAGGRSRVVDVRARHYPSGRPRDASALRRAHLRPIRFRRRVPSHDGWVNPDVIGIDLGITLLSAENLRTGRVWTWFMANPEITRALQRVGLKGAI